MTSVSCCPVTTAEHLPFNQTRRISQLIAALVEHVLNG